MDYLTLTASTPERGPIYERDIESIEVFGPLVRELLSCMVKLGLISEQQKYWAIVTLGFEGLRPLGIVLESRTEGQVQERLEGRQGSWLTVESDSGGGVGRSLTYFTVELNILPPDAKTYRRSFAMVELDSLTKRVTTSLKQTGVLRDGETVRVELSVGVGDRPRAGREIVHSLPADLSELSIKIEEIKPQTTFPERELPTCRCGVDHARLDTLGVFVRRAGFEQMNQLIRQRGSNTREIGGVLIGAVYRHPGRETLWVDIEDSILAEETLADAVSLRFTHETWQRLLADMRSRFPESKRIVGWYHTHPTSTFRVGQHEIVATPYFSTADLTVHQQAFSEVWQVALVTDARTVRHTLFRWSGDAVAETPMHLYD